MPLYNRKKVGKKIALSRATKIVMMISVKLVIVKWKISTFQLVEKFDQLKS